MDPLIKAKAEIECRAHKEVTPLHVAAFAGNANLSVTLLGARASVSAVDIGGNTPRAHLWHSIPSQE